jgi:transcriptional regulator with XRE-family HTH domain
MGRDEFHNSPPSPDFDATFAPDEAVRREFAKRLQAAILERGWTQSELARRAGINRDNVSGYIRGQNRPGPTMLKKMADALGVASDKLMPMAAVQSVDKAIPAFQMVQLGDGTDRVWLRINQAVTWPQFLRIAQILKGVDERA